MRPDTRPPTTPPSNPPEELEPAVPEDAAAEALEDEEPQAKSMLRILRMEAPELLLLLLELALLKATDFAAPHLSLVMVFAPLVQLEVCVQVEPSVKV